MARSSDSGKAVVWRRRFGRFLRSGLTVAQFCVKEGVSTASFYRWRNRLADQRPPTRGVEQTPAFQAVQVTRADAAVAIHLPGGVRVEVPTGSLDAIRAVLGELLRQDVMPDRGASPC
jgi:hypothetical protein